MRGFIQNKLVTVSTGRLTAISIVISVVITAILTGATSLLLLGRLSIELFLANSVIGTIVPGIVAPFAINLLKQATNYEQINQELANENQVRKKLEDEARQQARDMQFINELAIECAAASPETDIIKLIADKLRDITNAMGVAITLYDPAARTLTTRQISVSGKILSAANRLAGQNFIGMVTPVTPEMETHMVSSMVESFSDLSEVSFGVIPRPVANLIKNTLGVGKFTGMALSRGGKLIGTAIIAQHDGQRELNLDVCKTLAHVAAVSIQRKKTEDSLRESETKFRAIIENLSDGILLLDEQGTIIEWNPYHERLTGLKREEVIGKPIWDIQYQIMPESYRTPEFYERIKQQTQSILDSGKLTTPNHRMEGVIHSLNGDTKFILQTSFPIRTDAGYRVGSIMRDITNQKQVEADRERLISELKSKNTELEQFTHTVSHDLKAPLITIKGFLGLLEKDAFAGDLERMQKDVVRINEATDKMYQLLNELLELSRIGRFVNPSQEVPFERIVQDAIKSVQGRLSTHGVRVEVERDLPIVFVDHIRLIQVVQNLLDNAAKFMGTQSDPLIKIGIQGLDPANKPILFIQDNGIGIDPQQLENVFGLFRKLDSGADGTGIGLALVKRIIEVHGGRIWIVSDGAGSGTTVCFTLPVPQYS